MDVPRRTQAERRASAQNRVLQAATELVAEHGITGMTLAAVGDRAGFSRGIVNHHFGTRQALLEALTVHLQGLFRPPGPTGRSGLEALVTLARAYLAHVRLEVTPAKAFLVLWTEALTADPNLRHLVAECDEHFRQAVVSAVQAGREDGSVSVDADPVSVAYLVIGLLRGVAVQCLVAPGRHSAAELDEQVDLLLSSGLAVR